MKTLSLFFILFTVSVFAQSGEELYQKNCSHCHGVRLQGGNAQSLVDGVWQFGDSSSAILRNIKFGITHLGMPAYEKTLTDPEIRSIVEFLRNAENEAGAARPPLPQTLQTLDYDINVAVFAEGLEVPWDLAFLDKEIALVTERPGRLRVIENGRLSRKPVEGIPKVVAEGQGGLLAVAFDPDYKEEGNQWIYLAFSHGLDPVPNGGRAPAMTKIVRGRINGNRWVDEETLFEAPHETYKTTRHHYGCRIVFDRGKNLLFSIGDRGTGMNAQDPALPNGKIHRIRRDGTILRLTPAKE